jgi:DNA-binding NarL/FixJ family response regulator
MKVSSASKPVVILESHQGLRCLLRTIIDEIAGLHFAAEAGDSHTARQALLGIEDPIIVANPWLHPCGVFHLKSSAARRQMVLYSQEAMPDVIFAWAVKHHVGAVMGTDPVAEVRHALHAALANVPYYSSSLRNRRDATDSRTGCSEVLDELVNMPAQRLAIMLLNAQGRRVKQIAEELGVTAKAVDSQLYRIRRSLGVHDRVELTLWCLQEGLINIPGGIEKTQGLCVDCNRRNAISTAQILFEEYAPTAASSENCLSECA